MTATRIPRSVNGLRTGLCALCALVLVTGCASSVKYDTSTFVTLPRVGTLIKLNRELAGRSGARIFLQYGHQLSFREVAKLDPYCQFYVHRPSSELRKPLLIAPDTFVVHRVYRLREFVSSGAVQVADGAAAGRAFRDRSERTMSTVMEVVSDKQPAVTRLICSRWADPQPMHYLSIDEIVMSLGEIAEFIPPAGQSTD
jgi:hypothetical protein